MPFESGSGSVAQHGADVQQQIGGFARKNKYLLLLVFLPTLLTAIYYFVFAADQYVTEASFLIRSPSSVQGAERTIGKMAALGVGGEMPSSEEAAGIADFLESHDAARALQERLNIVAMYHKTGLDVLEKLKPKPTNEELTKHYKRHIKINFDKSSGIIKLTTRAFTPQDSYAISQTLLQLSEELVNTFGTRPQQDNLRSAKAEVERTRAQLSAVGGASTASQVVLGVVGGLEGQLATARAEYSTAASYLRPESPRLQELGARVSALQGQLAAQGGRLDGPGAKTGDRVISDRAFAMQEYQAAMTSYESARQQAMKQQQYLVRIVQPNVAEKSLYPKRFIAIFTVFLGLLVAYGIGWLIITGAREHAM